MFFILQINLKFVIPVKCEGSSLGTAAGIFSLWTAFFRTSGT